METPCRTLIAHKWQSKSKNFSKFHYVSYDLDGTSVTIPLVEDTEMCDGIGGIIWEGSIVLCEFLCSFMGRSTLKDNVAAVELGAGTGLSGLVSALCGVPTLITDRYSDLAERNVQSVLKHFNNRKFAQMAVRDYSWGEDLDSIFHDLPDIRSAHKIVYGAEIACLMKQHDLLVQSIKQLADSSPSSLFFITFDGSPSDPDPKYKVNFMQKMKMAGFASAVVFTGSILWEIEEVAHQPSFADRDPFPPPPPRSSTSEEIFSKGYFRNLTNVFPNNEDWLSFVPTNGELNNSNTSDINISKDESVHHVIAFFKMSSLRLCSRCNRHHYMPILSSRSCQFHKGLYVCRQHPAELKLSVDGLGDNLGYYGTGEEWKAHFWDCCGIESQTHPGCCWDYHQMYK